MADQSLIPRPFRRHGQGGTGWCLLKDDFAGTTPTYSSLPNWSQIEERKAAVRFQAPTLRTYVLFWARQYKLNDI